MPVPDCRGLRQLARRVPRLTLKAAESVLVVTSQIASMMTYHSVFSWPQIQGPNRTRLQDYASFTQCCIAFIQKQSKNTKGYAKIFGFWGRAKSLPLSPLPFPSLPFLSLFPPVTFLSFPLEVGPLNTALEFWERCKLPQRSLGGAPEESEFGAFFAIKNRTSGGA